MTYLYGGDGSDIYNNAMVWASRLAIQLTGPESELSGTVKYGYFPVGSMFDDDQPTDWNIKDLERSVYLTESLKKTKGSVSLQNAIVNHDVGMKMGLKFGNAGDDNAFAGEYVSFAILQKPFVSLGDGVNVPYTMEISVGSNYVANPRVDNAFARSLNTPGLINGGWTSVLGDVVGAPLTSYLPNLGKSMYNYLPTTI